MRVVGDHVQEIDDLELVLITQCDLRHTWQGTCSGDGARIVTMQFPADLVSSSTLRKERTMTTVRLGVVCSVRR